MDLPTWEERIHIAIKHLDLAIECKGEWVAVREMRKHISLYIKGMRDAARLREDINKACSRDDMLAILNTFLPGAEKI